MNQPIPFFTVTEEEEAFNSAVSKIRKNHPEYPVHAYRYVDEVLRYAIRNNRGLTTSGVIPIFIEYTAALFGDLGTAVLASLNIHCLANLGDVLYNMIEEDILQAGAGDSRDDFKDRGSYLYDNVNKTAKEFLERTLTREIR